jgi:hypothetical protein
MNINIKKLLADFCATKNNPLQNTGVSNRGMFIVKQLNSIGLMPILFNYNQKILDFIGDSIWDYYYEGYIINNSFYREKQFYNIVVPFENKDNTEGIIINAHYDIVNINSDNCNDNSASVVNLIALCSLLKDKKLPINVYITFTDLEEIGGKGAEKLSKLILRGRFGNIKYILNLELTALGNFIWIDNNENELSLKLQSLLSDVDIAKVIFNDSYIFNEYGIPSTCIGTLPKIFNELDKSYWYLCHSNEDKLKNANFNDMENFIAFLEKFVWSHKNSLDNQ